jgi:hypothetical protein
MRTRGQDRTPRLGVVLERTDQYRAFALGPFGPEKYKQQAVAILFTKSLRGADVRAMVGFPRSERHAGVRADEIFVYFADFERVAKWEVQDLVAGCELENFTASLVVGTSSGASSGSRDRRSCSSTPTIKRGGSGQLPSR